MLMLAGSMASAQVTPASTACTIFRSRDGDSLALVLSGGGTHGLAHIGVLEVLDSLGVRPRLVVGTSMGALIGALYAGGLSGREIDSVARNLPLEAIFRRYPSLTFITSGDLGAPLLTVSPAFVFEQLGATFRLQSPAAREAQLNALFDQLLLHANLVAAGDFARLPIPFVAVATDMRTRAAVVLDHGDLAQAVRASASIPLVVSPVTRGEQMLIDGALSANVPVAMARQRGMTRLVVSDVGTTQSRLTDVQTTTGMIGYLLDGLFSQGPYALTSADIAIRPDVDGYGLLNFSRDAVGPLIHVGYEGARATLRACAAPPERPPSTPKPMMSADARRIGDRLGRLLAEGVYESVWLNPRFAAPDSTRDSSSAAKAHLAFAPLATVAPGHIAGVGLAYDNHDGVRAWGASSSTALADGRIAANGAVSLGEWRQQLMFAMTGLRRHPLRAANAARPGSVTELLPDPRSDAPPWSMLTRDLLRPAFSITGTRETVRLYDDAGHELARPTTRDLFAIVGATASLSAGWQGLIGPVAHLWHEDGAPSNTPQTAVGGVFRVARVFATPSTGPDRSTVPVIASELLWTDHYRRGLASADLAADYFGVQLRPRASLGIGEHLPLGAELRLGGASGFPGLMPGERRGERVGFVSVAASHALVGPLYWRIEVGRGVTRSPDEELAPGNTVAAGWVTGVDSGIAADTPLGPLTISVGAATGGRRVFKLRVGD